MKKLILMRHAKSSWDDLTKQDHDRTLNNRGQQSATAIGKWLRSHDHVPDQVISSSAQRCRETIARVLAEVAPTGEPKFVPGLYLAGYLTLYEVLKQATGSCVLMCGHNPGFAEFAENLLGADKPAHPRFRQYPTAATTVFAFDIPDWSTPFMGKGVATDFVVPRDLLG
jgi:phosphohistidine phosphatase